MSLLKSISAGLSGLSKQAADLVGNYRDRETAEALVAIMTGCAWADGEFEEGERVKLRQAFSAHPILSKFNVAQLTGKFDQLNKGFALDVDDGLENCLAELDDIVSAEEPKKRAVMRMGLMIAKADGEVEPAEKAFLAKCARRLLLEPSEFDL
jgi:tellurite resistance protein TerB